MDNIITAIILLALTIKSTNKELLVIVATGCILSEVMFQFMDDVVLYYSIMTTIAASLAFKALSSSDSDTNCIYAVLILCNGILCALLIPSFSPEFNILVESTITSFNEYMLIIVSILAILGTDNLITRKYHESKTKE